MNKDAYFSRRALTTLVPSCERCVFCGEKLVKKSNVYQFARVDPKGVEIEYAYSHISCGDDNLNVCKEDDLILSDEQIRTVWDGVENLQTIRENRKALNVHTA